jgi:hypothetical protein
MKQSILRKSILTLVGILAFSISGVMAQDRSDVYKYDPIVKDKLEVIKSRLNLSEDQINQIKSIDLETENKLEAAANNTEARKVYKWRDGEYKKVMSTEQFRKYQKEQQQIVDEAQFKWMYKNGTPVPMN